MSSCPKSGTDRRPVLREWWCWSVVGGARGDARASGGAGAALTRARGCPTVNPGRGRAPAAAHGACEGSRGPQEGLAFAVRSGAPLRLGGGARLARLARLALGLERCDLRLMLLDQALEVLGL